MSTSNKHIKPFVEQYVRDHFEVDSFSVDTCEPKEENGEEWYEAVVYWGKEDKWQFTLYFKSIEGHFKVHYSDGTLPVQIYTLVPSNVRGRYALDDGTSGRDISTGQGIEVRLGGQWISGRVEYDQDPLYVQLGMQRLGEKLYGPDAIGGYVFISDKNEICGLCVGMKVKI